MRKIISKLPFRLRLAWRDSVDRLIQKEKRDVNINDMSEFIADKARATTHPVFGVVEGSNKQKQQGQKGTVYAQQGKPNSAPNSPTCPLCSHGHFLPRCETFKKMSLGGRLNVIKDKRLCRNCLTPGISLQLALKTVSASFVHDKHSTFLHPTKSATTPANAEVKSPEAKDKLNMAAGVKGSRIGLAVVPVRVKVAGFSKSVVTYAFLDNGSNTTFCTDDLLKKLNAKCSHVNMSLTTMNGETPMKCKMTSLEILDLDGNNCTSLPKVYSRPNLPITRSLIANRDDLTKWPHLNDVL
ncbi:uncharacterized protein LOC117118111 [Anneissia japonica]|uniref:uncharacterized protein LOC117118111 n=1 Tax=Anneissia japonica TaxID=1529436 RepID=UPI001425A8E2|nr:uncharacterized protein LOC117118111 [Anneissia japonica]